MSGELWTMGRPVLAAPGEVLFVAGGTETTSGAGSTGTTTSGGSTGSGGTTSGGTGSGSTTTSGGTGSISNIIIAGGGGQSNANYATNSDGAMLALAQGVAFYLDAGASLMVPGYDDDGIGLYNLSTPDSSGAYSGSYLNNADAAATLALYNDTRFGNSIVADVAKLAGEAAAAALGTPGLSYQAAIIALSAAIVAGTLALVAYWGESDSLQFVAGQKAIYKACCIRWMALVRAMFGKTAAQLPFFWFGPPYGLFPNVASAPPTIREVWAELEADPAQNAFWLVRQTYDTISRNDVFSTVTGVASGGNTDGGHRSAADNLALFRRGALRAARAILESAGTSAVSIPSALGTGAGPSISIAKLAGSILTLTVSHDGGTDLVVPLLAAQGVGFAVMDGGSIGSPGPIIQATSCVRVDATHLTLQLASAPASAAAACRLMYPCPGEYWSVQPDTEIGRGCAVTDNFASIAKPAGFDISTLGTGWGANMPLQPPVQVDGTGASAVATFGLALSS